MLTLLDRTGRTGIVVVAFSGIFEHKQKLVLAFHATTSSLVIFNQCLLVSNLSIEVPVNQRLRLAYEKRLKFPKITFLTYKFGNFKREIAKFLFSSVFI